jgi:hypothetical protein
VNKQQTGIIILKNALLLDDAEAIKHEIRIAISNFEPGYNVDEKAKAIKLSDLGFSVEDNVQTRDKFG